MDLPSEIEFIVNDQGWDESSLLGLALQFIKQTESLPAFHSYLRDAAILEMGFSGEDVGIKEPK